jgi:hypothetical protein
MSFKTRSVYLCAFLVFFRNCFNHRDTNTQRNTEKCAVLLCVPVTPWLCLRQGRTERLFEPWVIVFLAKRH